MEWFGAFAKSFSGAVWGVPMAVILTTCGVVFTFMAFGIQLRALTHGFNVIRGKYDNPDDTGNISHFQALCTALSATIGLGNISGVSVAVATGGAGAVFWMWCVGFLGMATKFMTCSLATMYREEDSSGTFRGGPMYYIEIGLGKHWKPLAILFAALGICASLGAGNMFQSNQVAGIFTTAISSFYPEGLGTDTKAQIHLGVGVVLFICAILVILGGIKRIGAVASKLVPTMCVVYCLGALYVILRNFGEVPGLFGDIFQSAFSGTAVQGAFFGVIVKEAVILGVKRACFSNEAGLGSAPIAHSAAKTNEPIREGVVAAVGPFIDTIVICTMTALVILITQSHVRPEIATVNDGPIEIFEDKKDGKRYLEFRVNPIANEDEKELVRGDNVFITVPEAARTRVLETNAAPSSAIDDLKVTGAVDREERGMLVVLAEITGEDQDKTERALRGNLTAGNPVYRNIEGIGLTAYAFDKVIPGFGTWFLPIAALFFAFSTIVSWGYYGETCTQYIFGDRVVLPFKLVYVSMILVGAYITELDPVLNFSDAMLGLMLVPNLIGTFLLAPRVMRASRDYFARLKNGDFEEEVRLAAEAKRRDKNK